MKDAELIRSIIRLRSADRPADEVIAKLGKAELASQPEATIVAIVRGYYEFKSNGYEDADIYREIEGRREQAYGEEPLPPDLNLDNYTRYRMRLEFPNQTALHDPVFVMQAVHKVREALEREYGPSGMPITFRTMPWMNNAILAFAAVVGVIQGFFVAGKLNPARYAPNDFALHLALALVAVAVVAGSVGFVGRVSWGRPLLLVALCCQLVVHGQLIATTPPPLEGEWFLYLVFVGVLVVPLVAILAYVYRQGRAKTAPA